MSQPSELRIVVCGLARDCRKNLERNWSALQQILGNHPSCDWVVVENDSIDGTREWLEERARENPHVHIIGKPIGEVSMPQTASGKVRPWFSVARIGKMAFFRNQYLEYIRDHIGFSNVDAIVVVDFDVHRLPIPRLRYWLEHFDSNTVVTAFGTYWRDLFHRGFYDAYAFLELEDCGPQTETAVAGRRVSLYRKYRHAPSPVKVLSNFSGCAIYPAHLLEDAAYEALPNHDPHLESLCEHVNVHRKIREKGGQLLLDPRLKVIYSDVFSDWKRYLVNLVRTF